MDKNLIYTADELATYIESLKLHLSEGEIKDSRVASVVKDLPLPRVVRNNFSNEEVKVLFDTVRWAWKEISKQDLIHEAEITHAPETLSGNYWMLKNGLLLHGSNHFTIIKQNLSLFSSLLNIHAFTLHEKISKSPSDLIKLVIDHGGMRIFVTKDKKAFFQMNDKTYGEWGRAKVKGLDFKDKTVKLIDKKIVFDGWNSGIEVKL